MCVCVYVCTYGRCSEIVGIALLLQCIVEISLAVQWCLYDMHPFDVRIWIKLLIEKCGAHDTCKYLCDDLYHIKVVDGVHSSSIVYVWSVT